MSVTNENVSASFLCIPASSTPAERIFSAAGNICSQKRASLSREHVDMLTFLHFNSALIWQSKRQSFLLNWTVVIEMLLNAAVKRFVYIKKKKSCSLFIYFYIERKQKS